VDVLMWRFFPSEIITYRLQYCKMGPPWNMDMVGSYEMPGVPAEICQETLCDLENLHSFIPHIIRVEYIRGSLGEVGSSWNEHRRVHGREMVLRKTITRISYDPFFKVNFTVDVEGQAESYYRSPDAVETCTFVVEPSENGDSCTVSWTMAYVAAGVCGKILSALCKPCLLRSLNSILEAEMQCYYEEALRRVQKREGTKSATEENSSTTT